MKDYSALLEQIEKLVTPVLESLQLELIEREFVFQEGRFTLRLYIDKDAGPIVVEDCQKASRAVEGVLDVEDIIHQRYSLEVSSPGLNRPLRHLKDFERFKENAVEIQVRTAIEGRYHFSGKLKGLKEEFIVVEEQKELLYIPFTNLKKAKVRYSFEKK